MARVVRGYAANHYGNVGNEIDDAVMALSRLSVSEFEVLAVPIFYLMKIATRLAISLYWRHRRGSEHNQTKSRSEERPFGKTFRVEPQEKARA